MNRKNLLIIAVALLLVAIGNRLIEEGVKQVDSRLIEPTEQRHDYYIKDFTITALDQRGRPQHRLEATQLSHFNSSETTLLTQPELQVYEGKKVVWRINAEHGKIHQQRDEVVLQGKVRLAQTGSNKREAFRLDTSLLRINPDKGRADTDRAVTLTQGDNRIDAVGLKMEQESQRLLLLSQVRGRYETLAP